MFQFIQKRANKILKMKKKSRDLLNFQREKEIKRRVKDRVYLQKGAEIVKFDSALSRNRKVL